MTVTPSDIRKKEFRRSVRGYLDEDVDVFLDAVADEFERIAKLNKELHEKVKALEEQVSGHAHIREALEKTLVAAQLQSEEIRSKAQKESQSMLREAEAKAKTVVDDFYAKTRAVQQTLMQLKLLEEDFRFKFKGMLEGYLRLLEQGPLVVPGEESPADDPQSSLGAGPPESEGRSAGAALERDDDPTSETMEEEAGLVNGSTLGPTQEPFTSASGSSRPSEGGEGGVAADIAEDLTVESSPVGGPSTGEPGIDALETGAPKKGGGVYFGKTGTESDDPFPEIGGEAAQPRDFRW